MYMVMFNTKLSVTVAPAEMAVKPSFANFVHINAKVPVFKVDFLLNRRDIPV